MQTKSPDLLIAAARAGYARCDISRIARDAEVSHTTVRSVIERGLRGTAASERVLRLLGLDSSEGGAADE